jgi:hypothetical protein
MPRGGSFRQTDAARALRAAVAAGLKPSGYVIAPDGSIRVEFIEGNGVPRNPLDRLLDQ